MVLFNPLCLSSVSQSRLPWTVSCGVTFDISMDRDSITFLHNSILCLTTLPADKHHGCSYALRRCPGAFTATWAHHCLKANVMLTGSPGTFLPSCPSAWGYFSPGAGPSGVSTTLPSFVLYGNLPRIHSGPLSRSLMKVLNNTGLSTDSYSEQPPAEL